MKIKKASVGALLAAIAIFGVAAPASAMPGPGTGPGGYIVTNTSTVCEQERAIKISEHYLVTRCVPGNGGWTFSYRSPF